MEMKCLISALVGATFIASTACEALAQVAICGHTLLTPPGLNVLIGQWHRSGGRQLCAGLVVHSDGTATYAFGDGNLFYPKGTISADGKTYSFVDDEGSTFTFHSDGAASFFGRSGKMVGDFKIYRMAGAPSPAERGFGPPAVARPGENEGFTGSTGPPPGRSGSTAPERHRWYVLQYAEGRCIASDVLARNARIPAFVSPGKTWSQATKEGSSATIETYPKNSDKPTIVMMTLEEKDNEKVTMVWFRHRFDCENYVATLPPNRKELN